MKRLLIFTFLNFLCVSFALTPYTARANTTTANEKEVVMMGVGSTEEAAKRQAYRNAIQSVIGSMVLSETIVENETLVKDKILSYSDGYVVKAVPVGSTRSLDGGLVEVTMRVTVKSEQLKAKLKSENISVASVDGQSLFAQKKTKDEAKQDAVNILKEKLKNVPSSLLVATAYPDKATQESKGSMVRLKIPVEVTVDKKAYATFARDLIKTLENLGFEAVSTTLQGRNRRFEFPQTDFFRIFDKKFNNFYIVGVCEAVFRESQTARWKIFKLPKEIFAAIASTEKRFELAVELLDKNNNAFIKNVSTYVKADETMVWNIKGADNTRRGWTLRHFLSVLGVLQWFDNNGILTIAPEVAYAPKRAGRWNISFPLSSDILTIDMPFDLSESELASVTSIKSTVSNIPVPK